MAAARFSRASARSPKLLAKAPPPPASEEELEEPEPDEDEDELTTREILSEQPTQHIPYTHGLPDRFRLYAAILLTAYGVEEYLVRKDLFGLTTASPLQRAVCRVINGYPLDGSRTPVTDWPVALRRMLAQNQDDKTGAVREALDRLRDEHDERLQLVGEDLTLYPEVREAFAERYPSGPVKEYLILAAIRCAKTLILAAAIVHRSLVAELDDLRPREAARAGIISWRVDLANTCYEYIQDAIAGSHLLKAVLVDRPKWKPGLPALMIRVRNRVSDRYVDILVLTAVRGGASGLSRWYIAFGIDEAARMLADFNEGVTNYKDIRGAVFQRIRKDGFLASITSPWLSTGPIYDASRVVGVSEDEGRVNVWAPGWNMNPGYWTPERCAEAKRLDPESFETDVAARFRRSDDIALARELVATVTTLPPVRRRDLQSEPPPDLGDFAVLDAGLRKEAVSFVIAGMRHGKRAVLAYREWVGEPERPLDLRPIANEVRLWMRRYQVEDLRTDKLSRESFDELLEHDPKLSVTEWEVSASELAVLAARLAHQMTTGEAVLPDDDRIREDLACVRRLATTAGDVVVTFPVSQSPRQSVSSRAILYAMGELYPLEEVPETIVTDEMRMHASMLRRHGFGSDPLAKMDRAVDELLERYDTTGEFYA